MKLSEWLGESKTALLIAITVVLCALSFGIGTDYSAHPANTGAIIHTVTKAVPLLPKCKTEDESGDCFGDSSAYGNGGGIDFIHYHHSTYRFVERDDNVPCAGESIPNPCDPDSNN